MKFIKEKWMFYNIWSICKEPAVLMKEAIVPEEIRPPAERYWKIFII